MDFDAIVLTGGGATRLGGIDKSSLRVDGRTLLDVTLDAVDGARRIVVVGPGGVSEQPPGGGPAAAIGAGVVALAADPEAADVVVVLACDMPGIAAAVPVLLVAGPGSLAREGDRVQYLAAVHDVPALRGAVDEHAHHLHGLSVRALLDGLDLHLVDVPAGSTADVDTWADADRAGVTR